MRVQQADTKDIFISIKFVSWLCRQTLPCANFVDVGVFDSYKIFQNT